MALTVTQVASFSIYAIGACAIWDDLRRRKVGNRWVAGALATAAIAVAYLGLNTLLGSRHIVVWRLGVWYLPPAFYVKAAEHFALSTTAALTLWYLRIWPAGDAKLYIALSALLVVANYNLRGFPGWLFLITLVNIFVAAGLFVSAIVLCEWLAIARRWSAAGARHEASALLHRLARRLGDEWRNRYNYAMLAWNSIVMFLAFTLVVRALRLRLAPVQYLAVYLALYLSWRRLRALLVRESVCRVSLFAVTCVLGPLAGYYRWDVLHPLLASIKMTAGFDVFLLTFRRLVDVYLRGARLRQVASAELREGMLLSEESWCRAIRDDSPEDAGLERRPRYADGLSGEDLRLVRQDVGLVSVYWHRPFAAWIFLGCLWTLHSRQNVVQWLTWLIRR